MSFQFDSLSAPLKSVIDELGYLEPTEIQKKAIPLLMGRSSDFVGQAQTGTGKTAAFCLPLLEKIDPEANVIQALILSPTRELANQIHQEIIKFTKYLDIRSATVYGGVGYKDQIQNIRNAHIVVATPGRAIDLLDRNKLKLDQCSHFIIDEADEMLKMGFIDDVEQLIESVDQNARIWMFSATMPKPIMDLVDQKLRDPIVIQIKNKTLSNQNVSQSYCELPKKDFIKALRAILLTEKDFYGIIFCETKEETKNLAEKLQSLGKRVTALHGDLNQKQRDHSLELFKSRKAEVLVCTDVASRGLDVFQVTHVINMGLPRKYDAYVHRVGRTGRAGETGKAISFVSPAEFRHIRGIERLTRQKITRFDLPCAESVKRGKILSELEKMSGVRAAVVEKGTSFQIDKSFDAYQAYFSDLSKEDIIKILFSYQFKSDFRLIDESLATLKESLGQRRQERREPRGGGREERRGRRSPARAPRARNRHRPRRQEAHN